MIRSRQSHLKIVSGLDKVLGTNSGRLFIPNFDVVKGYGFNNTEFDETVISSNLIYKSVFVQKIFLPEENIFRAFDQDVYTNVPFCINLKTGLLESFLGGEKCRKLISYLSLYFNFEISLSDIYIDIAKFYRLIKKKNILAKVLKISLNNFRPEPGLYGKFDANVLFQQSAETYIYSLENDILGIDLEVNDLYGQAFWHISSSGDIVIKSEEYDLSSNSLMINELVLECINA